MPRHCRDIGTYHYGKAERTDDTDELPKVGFPLYMSAITRPAKLLVGSADLPEQQ